MIKSFSKKFKNLQLTTQSMIVFIPLIIIFFLFGSIYYYYERLLLSSCNIYWNSFKILLSSNILFLENLIKKNKVWLYLIKLINNE